MTDESSDYKVNQAALMEQYKLITSSYEAGRQQRLTLNQTFVFLFSAIVGLYNFLMSRDVKVIPQAEISYTICAIGIIVGIFWMSIILKGIRSEKNKYKIIYEIESNMPLRLLSVPQSEKNDANKEKIFIPGYLELSLPLFMIAVLAANFVLFMINS